MRSIRSAAEPGAVAPTQMIWIPGAYHCAQDFLNEGFADAVRNRQIPLDLTFVDLEMRHLDDRETLERLRREIVLPAFESGAAIWLGGISLGGLMALDYASSYPEEFVGLCLLAPYLGNRMLTREIAAAPGLLAWEPKELAEADEERRIWRYVKRRPDSRLMYLGFGQDDRFSAAHRLLAGALPPDSVDVVAGGHEWRTWTKLWENFLDSRFK
ncbi:MAG TPA: alpha/beta hydrolase-fold protein [Steroidobacteraceae bacterium]